MYVQDGKRFRRSFCGYNRTAVDAEFNRLISQADSLAEERESLQGQLDTLTAERTAYSTEQIRLNTAVTTMTSQVMELESNLSHVRSENETLAHEIEAHKAEKNALQIQYEQLRERDRDFALREREFSELQSSVSSIMSVTKRATDRLFQKSVDNQERITQIAGDAAREVATIRADMAQVREQLNAALDEVQDRIDRVDATLTGAVHKLVAIKHDDGLQVPDDQPGILSEVEHLLSLRAGETDFADGKSYSVPVLGPYGAKFLSDTAQRVNDGRITARPAPAAGIEVHRVMPTQFESSDTSILEASKLLERGGMTAGEYYASNPDLLPPPSTVDGEINIPESFTYTASSVQSSVKSTSESTPDDTTPVSSEAIPMPAPQPEPVPVPAVSEAIPMPPAPESDAAQAAEPLSESAYPRSVGAAAADDPIFSHPVAAPVTVPVTVVFAKPKLVSVRAKKRPR